MNTLLTLDLGTTTGWALSKNGKIRSGCVSLAAYFDPAASRYTKFRRLLVNLKEAHGGLNSLVYEGRQRHTRTKIRQTYEELRATLHLFCDEFHIECEDVPVETMNKFITGHDTVSKLEVFDAIKARSSHLQDHHEAKALALLWWKSAQKG